jgi:hypothetical protein
MKFLPSRLVFIGLIILAFAVLIATSRVQATAPLEKNLPDWELAKSLASDPIAKTNSENLAILPPPPEQNPCLHCHIEGEIYNEWSPISRWFAFGAMGLTFIFGLTRNIIVWHTRGRWHHRWMLHLGRITAVFFIFQASTGILLFAIPDIQSEIIIQIMTIINAIHWGSSIILFIAALGFSLGGSLLPGYQRPFWAMIFITSIIGGALAVANLSFTYLYAEWHDPPPPSHLFVFHMLLSPLAIAGILNLYFVLLRKRGETQ